MGYIYIILFIIIVFIIILFVISNYKKDNNKLIEKDVSKVDLYGEKQEDNNGEKNKLFVKLMNEKKYKELEEIYLEELKKEPGHIGYKEGLGVLYLTIGQELKAREYMTDEQLKKFRKNEFKNDIVNLFRV